MTQDARERTSARHADAPGAEAHGSKPAWIPLLILAAVAIPLVLVVVYAEPIMAVLARHFPEGASPQASIFFLLAGVTVLAITISNLRDAARSRGWRVTQGRIVRSELETVRLSPGAKSGAAVTTYRPLIEYEYRVDGRDYRSRRVRLGVVRSTTREQAGAALVNFAVGSTVEVHYDPAVPEEALLETRVGLLAYTMLIAVVFLGLAVYFSGVL